MDRSSKLALLAWLLAGVSLCGCAQTGGLLTSKPLMVQVTHVSEEDDPAAELPAPNPPREVLDRLPPPKVSTLPQPPAVQEVIEQPNADERPEMRLDFSTALGLAQGQNPRIAFAQAQIDQAAAQQQAARVLWLPSIRGGMNYNKHEGRLQDVEGEVREISRGAAYGGLGANAVGAGSPAVPGLSMQFHLTDAIHQPLIAGHALNAQRQLSAAATNDQLLETALAYLKLLEAEQSRAIAEETRNHGEQLAEIIETFARTGAGNQADADRTRAALSLLASDEHRAKEEAEVASARLAQQLSVDPGLRLVPQETNVVPLDLLPHDMTMPDLVATSLANRPELAASRALVNEAVMRLRREKEAPWLPSLILGASYGAFGGGRGGEITNSGDRFDFDGVAYWELRNLGFGDRATRAEASARVQQEKLREIASLDLVAREVVEAHVQVQSRRQRISIAQRGIEAARNSYERNVNRIRNAQGLPIEVLQSVQLLDATRREYLRAVVDYNEAQFRLQRALGWPVDASNYASQATPDGPA